MPARLEVLVPDPLTVKFASVIATAEEGTVALLLTQPIKPPTWFVPAMVRVPVSVTLSTVVLLRVPISK